MNIPEVTTKIKYEVGGIIYDDRKTAKENAKEVKKVVKYEVDGILYDKEKEAEKNAIPMNDIRIYEFNGVEYTNEKDAFIAEVDFRKDKNIIECEKCYDDFISTDGEKFCPKCSWYSNFKEKVKQILASLEAEYDKSEESDSFWDLLEDIQWEI